MSVENENSYSKNLSEFIFLKNQEIGFYDEKVKNINSDIDRRIAEAKENLKGEEMMLSLRELDKERSQKLRECRVDCLYAIKNFWEKAEEQGISQNDLSRNFSFKDVKEDPALLISDQAINIIAEDGRKDILKNNF